MASDQQAGGAIYEEAQVKAQLALGMESWLYVIISILKYLWISKELKHSQAAMVEGPASQAQELAIGKLCKYIELHLHSELAPNA